MGPSKESGDFMIACLDVYYRSTHAIAACVLFKGWCDHLSIRQIKEEIENVRPYEPGRFYRRELPCLLRVLNKVNVPLEAVVIDGYAWLGDNQSPGLGAYLFKALNESVPVIGVAKNRFKGSESALQVFRGRSKRPLFITAAGIDREIAAGYILRMHGEYRIPTLLKEADRLCRGEI